MKKADTEVTTMRRRRSVTLSKEEFKALKAYHKTFELHVDCAEEIGIDRVVLTNVLFKGTGGPDTIAAILKKLTEKGLI